jgi:hypothetical protein
MSEYPGQARSRDGWPAQPPQDSADGYGPPPRRRRGRAAGITLLVLLLVLAAGFVIGDRVVRSYAQDKIAQQIQTQATLAAKPSVNIEGFPFLTQLAAHDLRKVDISARNVQEGKLDISVVNATASGVHLNQDFNGATIDQVSGSALITFEALLTATGAKGVTLAADPAGGPNSLKVGAGPITTTAKVTLTGPNQVTVKIESLGGILSSLIGQLPGYVITIPTLPAGLKVNSVSVTSQGVVLVAAAQHTTLSQ